MSKRPARSRPRLGTRQEDWMAVVYDRRLSEGVSRGRHVELVVDGVVLPAFEGESVAAALLAAGRRGLRVTPRRGDRRGCTAVSDCVSSASWSWTVSPACGPA